MAKTNEVSYSELETYRQCRLKHQLAYIEKWQTDDTSPALSRGTLFHSVMESHYRLMQRAQEKLKMPQFRLRRAEIAERVQGIVITEHLYDERTGAQTEEQGLVEWMYRGYVDLYENDQLWQIVDVEHRVEAWLPTERGTRSSIKLVGTVDLVVKDLATGGGLWIVDHKTCRDLPSKDLDMEDQTGIYTYLKRRQGLDIRGAIYNHVRTRKLQREMRPEERFLRSRTVRTPGELETMAREAMQLMREAHHPVEGDRPRTPDGERCGWKCNFTEPCLAGRKKSELLRPMLSDLGFTRRDTKPGPTFNKAA